MPVWRKRSPPPYGGGGGHAAGTARPGRSCSAEIAPGAATLAAVGDVKQLVATVRDQKGAVMAAAVSWSSLDTGVAAAAVELDTR